MQCELVTVLFLQPEVFPLPVLHNSRSKGRALKSLRRLSRTP